MKNAAAIFQKQLKDLLKNKEVLIQFIMFPMLAVIMEKAVKIEGMPGHFFTNLFATMYVGMAPLVSMSAIIAEEKEKNTLRVLLMANVKPVEYLFGIGSYIWMACMIGAGVMGSVAGGYQGRTLCIFLLVMAVGILSSMLIGAAIGTCSRNQMMATSLAVPLMMVFSFLPMLSWFNESIGRVARVAYTQQISALVGKVEGMSVSFENVAVILANVLAAAVFFGFAYKRCGLD